jgi:chromosome segregation ATPase
MDDQSDIQFPINQALLEEASKIKQELSLIKERIDKIEAKKTEVSPTVYQKVKQDYFNKLNEIQSALLEKKTDIDKELSGLYETRSKVSENLEQHKEELEEIKFRHDLGEYDDKAFAEKSREDTEKITKFEKVLSAINTNISRYEALFADEEMFSSENTEPSLKKHKAKPQKAQPAKEDTDYDIAAEEKNYFSPETDKIAQPQEPSSEFTKKTTLTGNARIIVIEGEQAGQEYKMKKETTIGRANTNTIVLKDAKVSRQHAVIKQTGADFIVIDLNSSNGVSVNHERVKEHVLGDGDQIQIGDHVMQFKL